MTINNKSERNYRGKCLSWPVTSYGGEFIYVALFFQIRTLILTSEAKVATIQERQLEHVVLLTSR